MNSGWIYAVDEDYSGCYLFSDNDWKEIEAHYSCPNCGYENFERQFANGATDECCFEYAEEMELVEPNFEEEDNTIITQHQINEHLRPEF
jgi:rubredoxin